MKACTLRWPQESNQPCGRQMIVRAARGVGTLLACSVHDGSAADATQTNPFNNRPRDESV